MHSNRSARARTLAPIFAVALALGLVAGPALGVVNSVTPSTNEANTALGWAHVDQESAGIGTTTLRFTSTRGFASCFEYRTDGDTSQKIGETNYNTAVTDGLYPFVCVNNSIKFKTLSAHGYVEVRMVFGAEGDERFDWTRFDVLPDARTKADCKKGGWRDFGFKNQGRCIKFVLTGRDTR